MANVAHKNLTGVNLHEPKGVASATVDKLYVSDGAGSGTWKKIGASQTDGTFQAGWVLLAYQDASNSATIDFVNGATLNSTVVVLNSTYDTYKIQISSLITATDDVDLYLRVGTGGGPTYIAANYSYVLNGTRVGLGVSTTGAAQAQIVLTGRNVGAGSGIGNAAGEGYEGEIVFSNPDSTTLFPRFFLNGIYSPGASNGTCAVDGAGEYDVAGAITAVRFLASSGNITSGRFTLFGMRKT